MSHTFYYGHFSQPTHTEQIYYVNTECCRVDAWQLGSDVVNLSEHSQRSAQQRLRSDDLNLQNQIKNRAGANC